MCWCSFIYCAPSSSRLSIFLISLGQKIREIIYSDPYFKHMRLTGSGKKLPTHCNRCHSSVHCYPTLLCHALWSASSMSKLSFTSPFYTDHLKWSETYSQSLHKYSVNMNLQWNKNENEDSVIWRFCTAVEYLYLIGYRILAYEQDVLPEITPLSSASAWGLFKLALTSSYLGLQFEQP